MSNIEFAGWLDHVGDLLKEWAAARGQITVLEAGGGAFTVLDLPDTHITSIDISAAQVEKNTYAQRKIVGDLHNYPFQPGEFDLIVCFDVLEHLNRPELVLESFQRAVKPGGLIYLAAPYNLSLAGLLAKYTPHQFHRFVYQHIYDANPTDPNKEHIDEFCFPTYMRRVINPFRLRQRFVTEHMIVRFFRLYARGRREQIYKTSRILGVGYDAFMWTARGLTLGRWRPDLDNFFLLIQRPDENVVPVAQPIRAAMVD